MKHRHTLMLSFVALPICVLLRAIQMYFTIDDTTGFVKQQYSAISMTITVIICAAVASVGLLAATIDGTKQNENNLRPTVAITSVLTGGMFVYQTVTGTSALGGAWYNFLLVVLALASALVFLTFGLKNIYDYKMPLLMLTIPVAFYIVKLISVFVSTSELSLVTENIFIIFTNIVLLWFVFEFASFENGMGDAEKQAKGLFASGLAAIILCAVASIPKLALASLGKMRMPADDISEALLNLAMGIFILAYIVSNFKNKSNITKSVGKHSA